jgi:hypothetical protein
MRALPRASTAVLAAILLAGCGSPAWEQDRCGGVAKMAEIVLGNLRRG